MAQRSDSSADLSIIIVNWNTGAVLRDCVRSIYAETRQCNFEVIVFDNASSDDSIALAESEFKNVRFIRSATNFGFSKGNNLGVREASGEFVILLNPDTVILNGALDALYNQMKILPQSVGVVGPKLLNADRSLQRQQGFLFPSLATSFAQYFYISHIFHIPGIFMNYDIPAPRQVDWLCGACLGCRKQVYEDLGGLDETIFLYCEDMDFCYRLKKRGYAVMVYPQVEVMHLSQQSVNKAKASCLKYQVQGIKKFYRSHHAILNYRIFKAMLCAGIMVRLALYTLLSLIAPARFKKDKAGDLRILLGYAYE